MAGIPGTSLDTETDLFLREFGPAGIILFSRNIENPEQLATLCNDLQNRSISYHGVPLFLAVDQEGGRVARLKPPFRLFPGNASIGADPHPLEKAIEFARVTAREMTLVGLNMNFAPVVDVLCGEPEKHLVGRTFGDDPERTAVLGRTIAKTLQENGILATAKHFPGLGRATRDPHLELPTIDADEKELREIHLPPFAAAFEEGVAAVMTSHAVYPSLDPELPATLSRRIMTHLLRNTMGYQGLLISDDLEMGAIKTRWGVAKGAVASFEAGADILLICENQNAVKESIRLMGEKLANGEIPKQRLDESLQRVKRTKSVFLEKAEKVSISDVRDYFRMDQGEDEETR